MSSDMVYCLGCNEMMQYEKYLIHLTANYCYIENNDDNDDNDADDEEESENNNVNIMDLDNPMIDRGFGITNLLDQFQNTGFGLGFIECYSSKYNITIIKNCSICLETYNIGSEFYYMKCCHEFCKKCSEIWFMKSCKCPLCGINLQNL
jgi:hypothetical protein